VPGLLPRRDKTRSSQKKKKPVVADTKEKKKKKDWISGYETKVSKGRGAQGWMKSNDKFERNPAASSFN
jgi:hypothetical protein